MEIESRAGLPSGTDDCPTRLQRCLDKIGQNAFAALLSEELLNPIKRAIVEARKNSGSTSDNPAFRQIAALGLLANPIVNFNVERYTSFAVGSCGGPFEIKCYQPGKADNLSFYTTGGMYTPFCFRRAIYHPHGMLDTGLGCIFTKSDYHQLKGTLALELAIHAAFASRLVIVGMSLDDEHLREHIANYRRCLGEIIWFTSPLRESESAWASANGVVVVQISTWSSFWSSVETQHSWFDREHMDNAWRLVSSFAAFGLDSSAKPPDIIRTIARRAR